MAKKKVKTNFGEIEKLHKDETVYANGKKLVDEIIKRENERNPNHLFEFPPYIIASAEPPTKEELDWEAALTKFYNTPLQFLPAEAEWITQIREFCMEEGILPTTLITAYKELKNAESSPPSH